MGLATLWRADTAKDLFKRIMKDTLVSGSATLCVTLALSGITRTSVPPAAPAVSEIRRIVEVEQVRPVRDPAGEPSRLAAAETKAPDAPKAPASLESGASASAAAKERARRPAATPMPAAKAEAPAAKLEPAGVRPEPVSAPLDIIALARRSEVKPESGEGSWLMAPVSLMRRTGQTIATTAVDVKDRMAGLTGAVWTVVVR